MTTSRAPAPAADGRPEWARDAFFYQIFPDRFCNANPTLDRPDMQPWGSPPDRDHFQGGDLAGITEHLGHLERLGVTGMYLNPIFSAGTNHRYDTWDYFAVDSSLGDLGSLRELVAEAHGRGIRVILDGVFNHCGDGHPAFRQWRRDRDDPTYKEWFVGWATQPDGALDYQTCGGAAYLPKLDLKTPAVRDHVLAAATYWIEEAGIDGWRLDVPYKVAHDFWTQFRDAVREVAPDAYLLGEVWRDAVPWLDVFDGVTHYRQRGNVLDYCLRDALDGEDFGQEATELAAAHGGAADWMVNLAGSHDTARVATLGHGDAGRIGCVLAAVFTLPGIPLIYYGDEIGMEGADDPDCRRAMPWEEAQWDHDRLAIVTGLARLRAEHPALRRGHYRTLLARNGLVAYERATDDDRVVIVLNPRGAQSHVEIPVGCEASDATGWVEVTSGARHSARDGTLFVDHVDAASFVTLVPVAGS